MQVHFVDHHDTLVLVEHLSFGTRHADVVEQIADPSEERAIPVRKGRKRDRGPPVPENVLSVLHLACEAVSPRAEKAVDESPHLRVSAPDSSPGIVGANDSGDGGNMCLRKGS